MPWTPWVEPPPQAVSVADFCYFPFTNAVVREQKIDVGELNSVRYDPRMYAGHYTSTAQNVKELYVLFDDGGPVAANLEAAWDSAQAGANVEHIADPNLSWLNRPVGHRAVAREKICGTLGPVPDCTEHEVSMYQTWIRQDFNDILTYRPETPFEFTGETGFGITGTGRWVEGEDFFEAPDGTYIRFDPSQAATVVGYRINAVDRDGDIAVGGYIDTSLGSDTFDPGWLSPASAGVASFSFSSLSEDALGFADVDSWVDAFVDGVFRVRLIGDVTTGSYPGFNSDGGTNVATFDDEYEQNGVTGGFAMVQYPRFSVWADDFTRLRWLHQLAPWVIWQWLFSDAWLSIRIGLTQTYY